MQGYSIHVVAGIFDDCLGPIIVIIRKTAGNLVQIIATGSVTAVKVGIIIGLHISTAAPAFVADAPELNVPGFILSVLPAQVSQCAIAVVGHIFNPVGHFSGRSTSYISGDIGLGIQQ